MSLIRFHRPRLLQVRLLLALETERLSLHVSNFSCFLKQIVSLPHSSASDAPIHPSVPAIARANLASRDLFSGVSSQVQYGRVVRCDKLNAVGAYTGPVLGVGTFRVGDETGKEKSRSSVVPDNLGRDSSRRMTGARARGDRGTLCVDGDTSPGESVIGGRSEGVLVKGVVVSKALVGGSMLLL